MKHQTNAKGKTDSKAGATNNAKTELEKKPYHMVPVNMIVVDEKLNPRQDYGNVEELMNSIAENGIRNALKGFQKEGKIYLREGFRRMRAVKLAIEKGFDIQRVPVLIEERLMSEEERTLEFLINNDGKPFTMLEQSEVIRRLLNFGWKVTDIVKKTGKARGYIDNLILLTKTPMKVQYYMRAEKISAHAVIQIAQTTKGDADKITNEVEAAVQKAKEAGNEKATPKHVENKSVKGKSFGKFYKWAEEIADVLAGKKDVIKPREEVLNKLLIAFENGQHAFQFAQSYFTESKHTAIVTKSETKKSAKKK